MNQNISKSIMDWINLIFVQEFNIAGSPVITQIYSIKFLTTFRLQIQQSFLPDLLNMLINILQNNGDLTKTSIIICIDKILSMKNTQTKESVAMAAVNNQNIFNQLVSNIGAILNSSFDALAMRCFFRILNLTESTLYDSISNNLGSTMNNILIKIIQVQNEGEYNYYFFETCALIMNKLNQININKTKEFELALRNSFNTIMNDQGSDLKAYIIQIFALYINLSHDTSDYFRQIFGLLMNNNIWVISNKYLFNPFLSYIKTYISYNSQLLNTPEIQNSIKNIFYSLINMHCTNELFDLMEYFVSICPTNNEYMMLVTNIINECVKKLNEFKKDNPKGCHELGAKLILILSKIQFLTSVSISKTIFEQLDNSFTLFKDSIQYIDYIIESSDKKLILQAYMNILVENPMFYANTNNVLKTVICKLMKIVPNLYKINFSFFGINQEKDLIYNSNSFNRLRNAKITFNINKYHEVLTTDENNYFFSMISKIDQQLGKSILKIILEESFKDKEKKNFINYAKQYNVAI